MDVYEPESMARPGMSAYGREMVAPTRPIDRLHSIFGEPPTIHPLRDSIGMVNPIPRPIQPMTSYPTQVERNLGGHMALVLFPCLESSLKLGDPQEEQQMRVEG